MGSISEGPVGADDVLSFGIDRIFAGISLHDRIKLIESIFLASAEANNDQVALKWLEIYEDTSCKAHPDENFPVKVFPEWLIILYDKLPVHLPALFATIPATPKVKVWMLKKIIVGWTPEFNSQSASIFQFLIKAHQQVLHLLPYDKEAVGWIPKLAKEHTSPEFTPEQIERWIEYDSRIPDDILQVLAKAWVRNGGWKLLREYQRSAKFTAAYVQAGLARDRILNKIKEGLNKSITFEGFLPRDSAYRPHFYFAINVDLDECYGTCSINTDVYKELAEFLGVASNVEQVIYRIYDRRNSRFCKHYCTISRTEVLPPA